MRTPAAVAVTVLEDSFKPLGVQVAFEVSGAVIVALAAATGAVSP